MGEPVYPQGSDSVYLLVHYDNDGTPIIYDRAFTSRLEAMAVRDFIRNTDGSAAVLKLEVTGNVNAGEVCPHTGWEEL